MSVVTWRTPWLSLAPRVDVGATWLFARTHRSWTALSLFAYGTELRVDANKRRIQVSERAWWTTRTRRLSFDEVDHVAFRFESLSTAFRRAFQERRLTIEAADQVERFVVELVLRQGPRVPLFAFFGEGSAMSGVIGALLDDTWLDVEGTQEDDARVFVRQLTQITGLGLLPRSYEQMMSESGSANGSTT